MPCVEYGDIAGKKDLAKIFHVPETTVGNWYDRRELPENKGNNFPEIITRVASGPLWDRWHAILWYIDYQPGRAYMKKVGYLDADIEAEAQLRKKANSEHQHQG